MFSFDPSLYAVSLALTVVFSVIRLAGHKGNIFKALAHCWVGFLFGAFFVSRENAYKVQALGITGVEVLAFLFSHVWPKILARQSRKLPPNPFF